MESLFYSRIAVVAGLAWVIWTVFAVIPVMAEVIAHALTLVSLYLTYKNWEQQKWLNQWY